MPLQLTTDHLLLRPFRLADYEAARRGDTALAAQLGADVWPGWLEFPEALPFWQERLRADPGLRPWSMYGYFDRLTGALLGGGGFKGSPDANGQVELGYGLAPAARGRGLATEGVLELLRFAFAQPGVRLVIAHTRPTDNPSTRVLQRAGFVFAGPVTDPEDGLLWRWKIGPGTS